MANEYTVNASDMTAVAKAIREKGGTEDVLVFPAGFVDAIGAIQTQTGPAFEYTGICNVEIDQEGNWKVTFLTGGVFTPLKDYVIDVFVVGAGGGGRLGGGGGGFCVTEKQITLTAGEQYEITIGEGVAGEKGGSTIAFGVIAEGGYPGSDSGPGGKGQSGGGGWANGGPGGNGGTDGENGEKAWGSSSNGNGGVGEQKTSKPFGEDTGVPHGPGGGGGDYGAGRGGRGGAYGGGDGGSEARGTDGVPNTGGGGGGVNHNGSAYTKGGSGVVMIRNSRE